MVSVLPGSGQIYCETFNHVIHSVQAASQQAEKMDFAAKPEIWIGERRYRNLRSNRNTKGVTEEEVVWGHSLDVPVFKFVKKNVTPWWNIVKSTLQNPVELNQTFQKLSNICGIWDFRISTSSTTCTVPLLNKHNSFWGTEFWNANQVPSWVFWEITSECPHMFLHKNVQKSCLPSALFH